jgi:hypothetical protein
VVITKCIITEQSVREVNPASSAAGFCEHGNELSGCIKGGKIVDQPSDYYHSKRTWFHEKIS